MKKIFSVLATVLFSATLFAAQGGTLTVDPEGPINPSNKVKLSYDGTGTNFDTWEPQCFIYAWLVAEDGQTFSKEYKTPWVAAKGTGSDEFKGLDSKRLMTYSGTKGKYSIELTIKELFGVADEDLAKIARLGVIVCSEWVGGDEDKNKTNDFFLDVNKSHEAIVGPKFYVTGDSAFVKDAANLDKDKAWKADAIKSDKDTLELDLKATEYKFKLVTATSEWKGYDALTEIAKGLYEDEGNICFTLKEAGKVQIIYNGTVFKLVGPFDESKAVELEDGYYLNGSHADWNLAKLKDYKFAKNEDNKDAEEYILKITLTKDQEIKACKIEGNMVKTWYGESNYKVTEENAGKKIVYFRPEKNSEWTLCDGHIYIAADEEGGGETPTPDFDGKFYITGNAALVGQDKEWKPDAIACTDSAHTFTALAAGDYEMKLTVDGKWETAKGFSDLAARPKGVTAGKDNNIKFSLAEAGDVKVKFDGAKITLEGKFDESKEISLADGYYLISDPWTLESIKAANKFEANTGTDGEFKLSTTLTEGFAFKVVEVKDNAIIKWYPEGTGTEYKVDAAHAGARTIYFRPAGNEEWKGFIYIDEGASPGDQAIDNTAVETKVIKTFENGQLVIIKNGVKYNANGVRL